MGRQDAADLEYAEHLLEALADPGQTQGFVIDTDTLGDTPAQYIVMGDKAVALVLTPRVRKLVEEALGALFTPDDGEDEDELRATRAPARGRFTPR